MLDLKVLIRGAGDLASGVAYRLHRSNFRVCLTEIESPLAVRRSVSFCEAVYEGAQEIQGVTARLIHGLDEIAGVWQAGDIPLLIDPDARLKQTLKPDVLVDAIMAKKNLGTRIDDAPLVIGLGPGFMAGEDVHAVIETKRGHNLGKVIYREAAAANTGVPGVIGGYSSERLLRAPCDGRLTVERDIGEAVAAGEVVAQVEGIPVTTEISGVVRGMIRNGSSIHSGMKVGDVDPRTLREYCDTISEKSMAIGGGVLEAILARFNR